MGTYTYAHSYWNISLVAKVIWCHFDYSFNAQVALSSEEQKEVLLRLHRDLRSIQEALHVVTTAMGFLAGEGGRLDMQLSQYLLNVLKLRKTEFCGRVLLASVYTYHAHVH